MTQEPRISAAIITYNEADQLPDLLDRLDWADQVVVVDSGSTDASARIAREAGAEVFVRPFDTFARQRNFAIARTTGDWVISIDADERPTPSLVRELRSRLPYCRQRAFRVPIRSSIFERSFRFSGTQDDHPIRVWRRGFAEWEGDVHERLRVSGPVGRLRGSLSHYTLPGPESFLAKMNRYTSLAAVARVQQSQPPRKFARWITPPREVFRRLLWKQGLLDGPQGWTFCLLSGLSEWVLADKHQRLWRGRRGSNCEVA